MSLHKTVAWGKLCWYVARAMGLLSMAILLRRRYANAISNPAALNPKSNPPTPENRLTAIFLFAAVEFIEIQSIN